MSDGGKGSKPRPFSVDSETYANNWDRVFGRGRGIASSEQQDNSRAAQAEAFERAILKNEYYDLDGGLPEN